MQPGLNTVSSKRLQTSKPTFCHQSPCNDSHKGGSVLAELRENRHPYTKHPGLPSIQQEGESFQH